MPPLTSSASPSCPDFSAPARPPCSTTSSATVTGRRVAVIVNDMSEINIDAALIAGQGHLERTEEKLVELTNGCICCTLREDLVEAVGTLARQNRFDQLVIESTGISEPMPVAATFDWEFEDGFQLGTARQIGHHGDRGGRLHVPRAKIARGQAAGRPGQPCRRGEGDARSIADLLTDQVEFADVLLLNKTDLVSPAQLDTVETLVRRLNPTAKLIRTDHGVVGIDEVLGTGLFDPIAAAQSPGWDEEIANGHTPRPRSTASAR